MSFSNPKIDSDVIANTLAKFSHKKILVFGDLIMDAYLRGKVNRISPEAPVPILLHESDEFRLGGAGNVALNLKDLGAKVYISGAIGCDDNGNRLIEEFKLKGIRHDLILHLERITTAVKTRVLTEQQQIIRIDREKKFSLSETEMDEIIERINRQKIKFDAILISDYGKGFIDESNFNKIKNYAHKNNIFLALDPKERNFHFYHDIDLMTPNEKEASFAAHLNFEDHHDITQIGKKLLEQYRLKYLLITLGKKGMALFHKESWAIIPTFSRSVFDVSGAGDTVIATFVLSYLCQSNLILMALIANLAAGVVISKYGTSSLTPDEILKFYFYYEDQNLIKQIKVQN